MKPTKTFMMTAAAVAILSTGAVANDYTNNATSDTSAQEQSRSVGTDDMSATSAQGAASVASLDANHIEQVQTSLRNEGYSITADGVWGPNSAEALRQFQQANGLSVTGQLDTQTLAALDIDTAGNR